MEKTQELPRHGVLAEHGFEDLDSIKRAAVNGFDFTTLNGIGDATDEAAHAELGGSLTMLRDILPKRAVMNIAEALEVSSTEELAEYVAECDYDDLAKIPRVGPAGAFRLAQFLLG